MGYSEPIEKTMKKEDLIQNIHTLPDLRCNYTLLLTIKKNGLFVLVIKSSLFTRR